MIRSTLLILALAAAGCGSPAANAPVADAHDHEHEHEHEAGPHGGAIIELGDNHAELVHDDAAGTVTVYILDGAATANVPVDAADATINVTHDGAGEQFVLKASPMEGEPEGKSSRFVSTEKMLGDALDIDGAVAAFVVTFDGAPHRGAIEHDHDHDHADHDHDH